MADPSLDDVIANYLSAVESGEQPDREQLFAEHPHHAAQLREFFVDLDEMNRVIKVSVDGTLDFTPPSNAAVNKKSYERLTATDPSASKRIGNYKLLQLIGSGGMGEVWMAEQVQPIRRRVALKLIKAGMDSEQVVTRFEVERQALAMMDHQNIAKVLDAGKTEDGRPYFVMELVQGISITQYCDQNKLCVNDRLNLFLPVCKAVQHAHQKGIIHRDLKPSNILVTLYDGRPVPKVIDFGLAKALQHQAMLTDKTLFTEFGQVVGTLQYMSPEQAEMNALDIDTRTDVYALGVLLYELLTGSTPIDKETLARNAVYKVLETIRVQDPPRPSARLSASGNAIAGISQQRQIDPRKLGEILRGDLDWIVMKALEKDRTRRYETANGFAADVEKYIHGDAVEARPPSTVYRFTKFVRKNRGFVASLVAIGVLLVVATFISTGFGILASSARDAAQQSERSAITERKAAERARAFAQAEADRASKAEKIAEMEAESAKRSQKETEKTLSRSNLLLSQSRWSENRGRDARDLLDDIPVHHRHIEWHLLRRRYQETVATLYGHGAPVTSVTFNPNAENFASSSRDGTIKLWKTNSGLDILTLRGHGDVVNSVAFSPDGDILASGSNDNTIKLWNAFNGVELLTLNGHANDVCSITFSPDGKRIASRSVDAKIKLWESQSGKPLLTLLVDDLTRSNLAFSPDGSSLASGTGNGEIKIWDSQNGGELQVLKAFDSPIYCIAFSPIGNKLAAGNLDYVTIWDTRSRTKLLTIEGHEDSVTCISFSPDGSMIATGSPDNRIKLWNSSNGSELLSFHGDDSTVTSLSFSEDGSKLISGAANGTIKQWDVRAGSEYLTLNQHDSDVQSVSFSPDGRLIASASKDRTIKLWDAVSCGVLHTLKGHEQSVESIAFSPDGMRIASGSEDTSIKLWDTRSGKELFALNGHTSTVTSVAFRPDGAMIVSGSSDGSVKFWNARNGQELMTFAGHKSIVTSIAFSPDGSRVASSSCDKQIKLWDSINGKALLTLKRTLVEQRSLQSYDYQSRGLSFDSDGSRIASGWEHNSIRVWDAHSGDILSTLYGHGFSINSVKFTPDGSRIVSASNDGTLKLWDSTTGVELLSLQMDPDIGLESVDFSPDGTRIVAGCTDDAIRLWDSYSGSLKHDLKGHNAEVSNATFNADDTMILSESLDNAGKVIEAYRWDTRALQKIQSSEPLIPLTPSRWSRDGRWFLNLDFNRIQVVNVEHEKSAVVQGFRQAKAALDPCWHRKSAETAEKANDWYTAAFHRAWQLKGHIGNAWAYHKLQQAVSNWESSSAGSKRAMLPRVVSNALSTPSGIELALVDAETIERAFRSRIGASENLDFDAELSDRELRLIQLAFEQYPSPNRLTLLSDTKLIQGRYQEALDTILASHLVNDRVKNLFDCVQFRQLIVRTVAVIRQQLKQQNDRRKVEVDAYVSKKLVDTLGLPCPQRLTARDADLICNNLWYFVREVPKTITDSEKTNAREKSGDIQFSETATLSVEIPSLHELLVVASQQHPNGNCLRTLGASYYRRGEFEKAIETLLRALPLNTIDDEKSLVLPSNAAFLALAYLKIGEKVEAHKYRVLFDQSMTVEAFDWSFKDEVSKAFGDAGK